MNKETENVHALQRRLNKEAISDKQRKARNVLSLQKQLKEDDMTDEQRLKKEDMIDEQEENERFRALQRQLNEEAMIDIPSDAEEEWWIWRDSMLKLMSDVQKEATRKRAIEQRRQQGGRPSVEQNEQIILKRSLQRRNQRAGMTDEQRAACRQRAAEQRREQRARVKEKERAGMFDEETQRLAEQRKRLAEQLRLKRAAMSEEERATFRQRAAEQRRQQRARQREEDNEQMRLKRTLQRRKPRADMTAEQIAAVRQRDKERRRQQRARLKEQERTSMTDEERQRLAEQRKRIAEQRRMKRAAMTEEEKKVVRKRNCQRTRLKRFMKIEEEIEQEIAAISNELGLTEDTTLKTERRKTNRRPVPDLKRSTQQKLEQSETVAAETKLGAQQCDTVKQRFESSVLIQGPRTAIAVEPKRAEQCDTVQHLRESSVRILGPGTASSDEHKTHARQCEQQRLKRSPQIEEQIHDISQERKPTIIDELFVGESSKPAVNDELPKARAPISEEERAPFRQRATEHRRKQSALQKRNRRAVMTDEERAVIRQRDKIRRRLQRARLKEQRRTCMTDPGQRLKRYLQTQEQKPDVIYQKPATTDELTIAESQEQKPALTDELLIGESSKAAVNFELPLSQQPRLECILDNQEQEPALSSIEDQHQRCFSGIFKRETFDVGTAEWDDTQGRSRDRKQFDDTIVSGGLIVPGHYKDLSLDPVGATSFGFQVKVEFTDDGELPFVNNDHSSSCTSSGRSPVWGNECPQLDRTSGDNVTCLFPVRVKTEPQDAVEDVDNSECNDFAGNLLKSDECEVNYGSQNLSMDPQATNADNAPIHKQIIALRGFLDF